MNKKTRITLDAIEHAAIEGVTDELHPRYVFSTTRTELLAAALRGEISLDVLAKIELASRGLDTNGKWVGFDKAREIHGVPHAATAL